MDTIEIKIEGFGAIERLIPQQFSLKCLPSTQISHLLNQLEVLFPQSKKLLEQCACAIGEDIVPRYSTVQQTTTLVLLSPVAGG